MSKIKKYLRKFIPVSSAVYIFFLHLFTNVLSGPKGSQHKKKHEIFQGPCAYRAQETNVTVEVSVGPPPAERFISGELGGHFRKI